MKGVVLNYLSFFTLIFHKPRKTLCRGSGCYGNTERPKLMILFFLMFYKMRRDFLIRLWKLRGAKVNYKLTVSIFLDYNQIFL